MRTLVPEGKTPVSHLQELCTSWGITPEYQLIALEGPIHEPIFEYCVIAGEYTATGKGPSKKKAKHNAAEAILTIIPNISNGTNGDCDNQTSTLDEKIESIVPSSCGDAPAARVDNPVGRLQELLQKRRWPPAIYECSGECGPPHARVFICTVHLMNLVQRGSGPSKKVAKKVAALAMLHHIENFNQLPDALTDPDAGVIDNDGSLSVDLQLLKTIEELKLGERKIETLTPEASQKINQFYLALKSKTGKTLASLQALSLNVPATNYCQMLEEIAEEQIFSVTYVDLPDLTFDGLYQCLVQLSSMPVAVCYSVGRTRDDAHSTAAHNALQYLKIMTRKV